MSRAASSKTRWGVIRGAALIGTAIAAVFAFAACSQAGAATTVVSPRATAYATAPGSESHDEAGASGSALQNEDPLEYTCELASDVMSEVNNADVGYGRNGLSKEDWRARIEIVREKTELLVEEGDPEVEAEIDEMSAAIDEIGDEPGAYAAILSMGKASSALGAKCAAHGTEIVITPEFEN